LDEIEIAARSLAHERLSRELVDPGEHARQSNEVEAYALQAGVNWNLCKSRLGLPVGHNIGCTTKVMQTFLGVHRLCAGDIFATTIGPLGVPALIADNFFNAGCVLGEPIKDWRRLDLTRLEGHMLINDWSGVLAIVPIVLGYPLGALTWLANSRPARERLGLQLAKNWEAR
jgi:2-keto-4-pentenoate hydratase